MSKSKEVDKTPEESVAPKFSIRNAIAALKAAVADGNLSPSQAGQMRRDLGVHQSYFTSATVSRKKRKHKRQLAKKARKVTHKNGHKGQKMTKGKR